MIHPEIIALLDLPTRLLVAGRTAMIETDCRQKQVAKKA